MNMHDAHIHLSKHLTLKYCSSKEGQDQESIQSSATPYPRHRIGSDKNTRKRHTQESQEASPFPAGDHKAVMNRQDSIIKRNVIHKLQNGSTKEAPPWNGQ